MLAYLLGSLSFAVIVSRFMGLKDPRSYGSKNPGATNVLRSGNKAAAITTLLLDGLKGWLPVVLVKWFGTITQPLIEHIRCFSAVLKDRGEYLEPMTGECKHVRLYPVVKFTDFHTRSALLKERWKQEDAEATRESH